MDMRGRLWLALLAGWLGALTPVARAQVRPDADPLAAKREMSHRSIGGLQGGLVEPDELIRRQLESLKGLADVEKVLEKIQKDKDLFDRLQKDKDLMEKLQRFQEGARAEGGPFKGLDPRSEGFRNLLEKLDQSLQQRMAQGGPSSDS